MSHSWSPTEKATPEVQEAADKVCSVVKQLATKCLTQKCSDYQVKADFERKIGIKFSKFIAVKYRRSPYSKTGEPVPVGATFYLIRVCFINTLCISGLQSKLYYTGGNRRW